MAEAQERLRSAWHPYHDTLQQLLRDAFDRFGQAVLVDCHSMPHEAVETFGGKGKKPDVVLGDRFGASAAPEVVDRIEAAFTSAGLRVARNSPFAGAYITQAYGRPSRCQHAVQVEIDRAIYMDETAIRPNANFQALRQVLREVVRDVSQIGRDQMPCAAE
jgi:N-formylglutamate deformylase